MPIIDTLVESISQQMYSQLNLEPIWANHCNFNIISGDMTGTYRFQTVFYGLTDMPAEFQKDLDYTSISLKNTLVSWDFEC